MKKKYSQIKLICFQKDCSKAYTLAFLFFCVKYKKTNDIDYIKKNYKKIYEDFLLTLD